MVRKVNAEFLHSLLPDYHKTYFVDMKLNRDMEPVWTQTGYKMDERFSPEAFSYYDALSCAFLSADNGLTCY